MTVKIRERKAKNGVKVLYLDIYNPNVLKSRTSKTLDLFVYENPTTPTQKKSNKEALEAAERIRSKMTIDLAYEQNDLGELKDNNKPKVEFITYYKEQTEKRYQSANYFANWDSVRVHIEKFCPNGILIHQIDSKWLDDFKFYLEHKAVSKYGKRFSQNTLYTYFNKIKTCLNQAYKDDIILKNPVVKIEGFKQDDVQREFLTIDEVKKLAKTECEIPKIKKTFLFSCLTGIRWSDINNLTWADLQQSETNGYWYLRFRQKKTKGAETLPISNQARELMGEIGNDDDKVFDFSGKIVWFTKKLRQWLKKAGINRHISFHCARHTFATLQLSNGTDIYTVSKLLGHRELKSTQVYAKVIDQKKIDSTNVIPNLDL